MILEILNSDYDELTKVLLVIGVPVIILLSLSIHECAHALVSYSLGDPTAKQRGRLTLNPLKHIHPLGTLCMLLFSFGWARPVPVEPGYYKNPKRGMVFCGIAGPLVNIMIGVRAYSIHCAMVWFAKNPSVLACVPILNIFTDQLYILVAQFFGLLGYYNILLSVFNLLPVPPLDGSRLAYAFLPEKYYFGIMKNERMIMLVMLVLLWIGLFDLFIDAVFTGISFCVELLVNGGLDLLTSIFSKM